MRIAMLTWESLHSVAAGGVAAHVTELSAALSRSGHSVHVFTRLGPGQKFYEKIDGVHYHRCTYPGHADIVDDANSMCRAFVDRLFAIEDLQGPFDIVHAHDWLAANAMIWIKQGRGRVGFFTVHSTEYGRCGNNFCAGRSHRIRAQERAGTHWADRVIAVSGATKDEVRWMYETPESKMAVVYNGVIQQRFDMDADAGDEKRKYGIGPLDPTVLFCGRLTQQKGPDILLEAIPMVLKHHPQARFVFAGDGDMRPQLERRTAQLGIGHAVRFTGYRQGEELTRLFKMADAVCVPSRNEPFGIVVLEAWSARKPVVATQVGGPNEYVAHEVNGLKIFPRPDSVAWGIGTLFADFDRARRMGVAGRQTVEERFTWDHISRQTLALYGAATNLPTVVVAPAAPFVRDEARPVHRVPPASPVSAISVASPVSIASPASAISPVAAASAVVPAPPPAAIRPAPKTLLRPPMYAAVEMTLRSLQAGTSIGAALDACRAVMGLTMLQSEMRAGRLWVVGESDNVLQAIQRCHEAARFAGATLTAQVTMLDQAPSEQLAAAA